MWLTDGSNFKSWLSHQRNQVVLVFCSYVKLMKHGLRITDHCHWTLTKPTENTYQGICHSGPVRICSFSDTPSNFAEQSNTSLIFPLSWFLGVIHPEVRDVPYRTLVNFLFWDLLSIPISYCFIHEAYLVHVVLLIFSNLLFKHLRQ